MPSLQILILIFLIKNNIQWILRVIKMRITHLGWISEQ